MTPEWHALAEQFSPAAVDHVRALYETPGSFSLTGDALASEARISAAEATRLLDELVRLDLLARHEYIYCGHCRRRLDGDDLDGECPDCHTAFDDVAPTATIRYELRRQPPRDVPWVLVLHGMNTHGTWQEELSWLIARSYRRTVPVAIYKYGIVRPGVLFPWRQRKLVEGLVAKIQTLAGQAAQSGFGGRPDVIAHSFGTWMIAHALLWNRDVRIGRLVLLGCIVRPDFDWKQLIDNHQVTHVLNHGASHDVWVRLSHFAIPDAGPGGVRGFAPPVLNVMSEGLRHSDYFAPESRMRELFAGVWQRFLVWTSIPPLPGHFTPRPWKPRAMRIVTQTTLIVIVAGIVALLALVGVAGVVELLRRLW